MSSVFFQISPTDYVEAARVPGGRKEFAMRIVSFANGMVNFVYLPEVSLNELSLLVSILNAYLLPNTRSIHDLQKYVYGTFRRYY